MKRKYKRPVFGTTVILAIISIYTVVFNRFWWGIRIPLYVFSALFLCASCYYIVTDVIAWSDRVIKPRIDAIPYARRVSSDYRLRTVVFSIPGVMSNILFALFNGVMGIMGQSPWFGSLSAYYILLSVMRTWAVREEREIRNIEDPLKKIEREITIYQKNSVLFIVLAIVLGGMVVLLEYSLGGKEYPGFLVYGVAAFTFYKITKSTIHILRERKKNSPLIMIIRRIGHVDACVSILTLQTALLAAFGQGQDLLIKILNGATGTGVVLLVLGMGIQGIVLSVKMYKEL